MNCDVCSAKVSELRRGRCWGCYARWVEARPVGIGARCCVCAERRRDSLKTVELLGSWMPMCYTCSGRATMLSPMPQTLAAIRLALRRERRADDRRGVRRDTRVFQYDRRGDDRRAGRTARGDDWFDIEDGMIVEVAVEGSDRITAAPPAPVPVGAVSPPPIPSAAMRPGPRPTAAEDDFDFESEGLTRIHDGMAEPA